ncbi:MAG: hypothetical protein V4662_13815 [Verrucomicrobiota bacterium]
MNFTALKSRLIRNLKLWLFPENPLKRVFATVAQRGYAHQEDIVYLAEMGFFLPREIRESYRDHMPISVLRASLTLAMTAEELAWLTQAEEAWRNKLAAHSK